MGRTKGTNDRKQEFIDASIALFVEKGYENTTVDDIANRMGVAKGLFYYYFKSKDAVLYAFLDSFIVEYYNDLQEAMCVDFKTPVDRIWAIVMPNDKIAKRTRTLMSLFRERKNQEFRNIFIGVIRNELRPVLYQTIIDSADQGYMSIKYPEETTDAVLALFSEVVSEGKLDGIEDPDELRRRTEPYIDVLARIMGLDMNKVDPPVDYRRKAVDSAD